MRINARLDDTTSRKLSYLQKLTGWGVSEIVRKALETYYRHFKNTQAQSAKLLAESGFIGCGEGPENLSETYKQHLVDDMGRKHDHR